MKTLYMFPGQGSQVVGMGKDLYESSAAAREIFDRVDAALGQKLTDLMFNGPMEELTKTANAQPAIFAVSAAMVKAAQEKGELPTPDFIAGHSLGEYTALWYAGCISLEDTVRLLRIRGDAMQDATPPNGGMAVVMGTDVDTLCDVCAAAESDVGGVCSVANDNAPGQIVISGNGDTVNRACELARESGAKRAMVLPVTMSGHCSLMQPAADIVASELSKIDMTAPTIPFISNMTTGVITDLDEIKKSLPYQMTHGVRWRESVLAMPSLGITRAIEIGPSSVLCGLVPRTEPSIEAIKLEV